MRRRNFSCFEWEFLYPSVLRRCGMCSQQLAAQLRHFGPLPLYQRYMPGDFLPFKALYEIGQPVAARIEIRVVDLLGVSSEDDLGVFTDAGNECLYHVGREVLGFITKYELFRNTASPNVGERFQLQCPFSHQII